MSGTCRFINGRFAPRKSCRSSRKSSRRSKRCCASPDEDTIERVSAAVIEELRAQGLTDGGWDFLEPHAYAVMRRIRNPEIAALHIMEV